MERDLFEDVAPILKKYLAGKELPPVQEPGESALEGQHILPHNLPKQP